MAITVTLPIAAPTGLSATLVAGGTLATSTTYYYIVIAYDQVQYSSYNSTVFPFHSPISAESSFTTDASNRSALIKWTNVAGATRYQILLSTTSGDYTNSGGYGTVNESVGSITSGVTGYTVTALSAETFGFHTCQSKNVFVGGIDKNLGILKVSLNGGTYSVASGLWDIYNAIVAAGFGAYVWYDGYTFILKGWIVTEGTTAGSISTYYKSLIFIKGGIHCSNPNFGVYFGNWVSDSYGANMAAGCKIDVQNSRFPIRATVPNVLFISGCVLTRATSAITAVAEAKNFNSYHLGAPLAQGYYCEGIRENAMGWNFRSYQSELKDSKCGIENNFGTPDVMRLKFVYTDYMHYQNGGNIYACTWLTSNSTTGAIQRYVTTGAFQDYYSNLYDCLFPIYADNVPYFTYRTNAGTLTSNSYTDMFYSINLNVIDSLGIAVSGATVSIRDSSGNLITWFEHDTTIDKKVTGTKPTTDRTTDANGNVNTYYIKAYKVTLAPGNTIADTFCSNIIKTLYYPFTISVSKAGYETQSIKLATLTRKTDLIISLKPTIPNRFTIEGKPLRALNPELGSSSNLLEL